MIRYEVKKAFKNRFFWLALVVGLTITIIQAVTTIMKVTHFNRLDQQFHVTEAGVPEFAVNYSMESLYTYWIGGSGNDYAMYLFYFIVFLLCAIPFAWSLSTETKSGYITNVITRGNRNQFYFAKYFAVFLSGGSVALFALIANFVLCACFFPAYRPDQFGELYFGLPQQFLFSEYFFSIPLVYVGIYVFLSFLMTGLWATVSISLSFFVKNKLAVLICPYLFLLFVQFVSDADPFGSGSCISPFFLIYPRLNEFGGYGSLKITLVWIGLILLFNIGVLYCKGINKDVL